jgi:signal transduction histidine kinase/DNA-binding response OmpR family regulator
MEVVFSKSGGWNWDEARVVMKQVMEQGIDFDLVFGYNDVMAREAQKVKDSYHTGEKAYFLGVDGLSGNQGGLQAVIDGQLDATFYYPTGGANAIQIAHQILNKLPFQRENILETIVIDSTNAEVLKVQTDQVELLQQKIEAQVSILDVQVSKYQTQRLILIFTIALLLLIVVLVFLILNAFQNKKEANKQLEAKNTEIEKQNLAIKKQRDQLVEVTQKLEEATQTKLRFFTNISHEFRTPLTLITGPLENLMQSKSFTPEQQRQFELMHRNSLRLLRLVSQLMDFRKLENKQMKLITSEQDLIAFLKEKIDSFRNLAEKKNIDFQLITETQHQPIWIDQDKLDKVFFNLLSNAFKFTPNEGRILIVVSQPKPTINQLYLNEIDIEIRDSGEGIDEKHVNRIFDRFFQAEKSHNFKGTGLGLSLSKEFIELHRGKIRVESQVGKGTTFTITLPLGNAHLLPEQITDVQASPTPIEEEAASPDHNWETAVKSEPASKENRPVILIVEDVADVREYVRSCLGDAYQIIEAADGMQGLKVATEEEPDLIISDIMMPKMNGLEMTKQIKTDLKTCHIPIILLTAKTSMEQKLEGLEEGADSYITKPFNRQHLVIRVRKLLEHRHKIREHYKDNLDFKADDEQLNRLDKKFLNKLIALVEDNKKNEDLSVEKLSEQLGISRVHLYRKIKKLTDMSVSEFVVSIKLKHSLELLRNSGLSISEIAYEVGFSSPSYFTKCFKNQFNRSPSAYRKKA